MDSQSALPQQELGELARVQSGLLGKRTFEEVDNLLGKLVGPFGSGPLRQQGRQAAFFKEGPGLVETRPGEAEVLRGLACRSALLPDPAQHLVFDLDQIAGVEEGIASGEGGIANRLWTGVESVVLVQGLELGVGEFGLGQCCDLLSDVRHIMPYISQMSTPSSGRCGQLVFRLATVILGRGPPEPRSSGIMLLTLRRNLIYTSRRQSRPSAPPPGAARRPERATARQPPPQKDQSGQGRSNSPAASLRDLHRALGRRRGPPPRPWRSRLAQAPDCAADGTAAAPGMCPWRRTRVYLNASSKDKVLARLRKIEGQVRGLQKMVQD